MTIHQTFNRNRFDGDGGVPHRHHRPSEPTSRTCASACRRTRSWWRIRRRTSCSNGSLSSGWQFRNSFLAQRTSDRYFVTEGLYLAIRTSNSCAGNRWIFTTPGGRFRIRLNCSVSSTVSADTICCSATSITATSGAARRDRRRRSGLPVRVLVPDDRPR